ncbi:MAG TPA: gamma-glutamyl-gamma-aminobutyrate hydrolase family protein [Actinomycetes bacterium]|nr:gamma-glutamyl-gamma-aminobutyrate hydrolase family protein [Actinomycetes bacterium]
MIGVTSAPGAVNVAGRELSVEGATERYVQMLVRAGAAPVILPVHGTQAEEVLPRLDGIALTGGGDVQPSLYGREPPPEVYGVDPERDRFEVELVRRAAEADVPMMAICRGTQMLNVALGGTLFQDIGTELGHAMEHSQPDRWEEPFHEIRIDPDSILGGLVGEEACVNSIHHQAIERVAPGLHAVAWAPDGVIEAVEGEGLRFCLGLQWHPEYFGPHHPTLRAVETFVRAAREDRGKRWKPRGATEALSG